MTEYEVHYCGRRHNLKYPCPPEEWRPDGRTPLSEIPPCCCKGLDHAEDCARRAVLTKMHNVRWRS